MREAVFYYHNCYRPSQSHFYHQRSLLFRYFYGFFNRKAFPDSYSISEPHSFHLIASYLNNRKIASKIDEDYIDLMRNFEIKSSQVYKWLVGDQDTVSLYLDDDDSKEIISEIVKLWNDSTTVAVDFDFMWRLSIGALKTGQYVSQYNIPGTKTQCLLCDECRLETSEHLFVECRGTQRVRDELFNYVKKWGFDFDSQPNASRYFLLYGYLNVPSKKDRSFIFKVIANVNRDIWLTRNRILFGNNDRGKAINSLAACVLITLKRLGSDYFKDS